MNNLPDLLITADQNVEKQWEIRIHGRREVFGKVEPVYLVIRDGLSEDSAKEQAEFIKNLIRQEIPVKAQERRAA